jgi:hypothetical protein
MTFEIDPQDEPCPDCGSPEHRCCPTPDGLGLWKGGLPKSSTLLQRKRPTQFASNKNTPGKSSSEVVERSPEYFKAGSPVKHAKVDTRFGYQTDMVKPYVPETTAE